MFLHLSVHGGALYQGDPPGQRPPDRDPLDRDPPPGQRPFLWAENPPWTDTPLDRDPLPLDRDPPPPGQRPSPLDRDPLPLDRGPPLGRDPPPRHTVTRGRYTSYWNAFLLLMVS